MRIDGSMIRGHRISIRNEPLRFISDSIDETCQREISAVRILLRVRRYEITDQPLRKNSHTSFENRSMRDDMLQTARHARHHSSFDRDF
jgi:hypothetical protein